MVKGNYYYYYERVQHNIDKYYPYHIYSRKNIGSVFASFSKEYFDSLLVDINIERKNKLEKLYEK